jgi:hypothetical protein
MTEEEIKKLLFEVVTDIIYKTWSLETTKSTCEMLPDNLKQLTFVQCILNGKDESALDVARDFLYADLLYLVEVNQGFI